MLLQFVGGLGFFHPENLVETLKIYGVIAVLTFAVFVIAALIEKWRGKLNKTQERVNMNDKLKIAVVGSGNMGSTLGKLWARKGHQVTFSYSKDSEKLIQIAKEAGENASSAESFSEAVKQSDVVMIAVWFPSLDEILRDGSIFAGKTIISCVSALTPDFAGQTIGIQTDLKTSVAEIIQEKATGAKVVEAFNSTFAEVLASESRIFSTERHSVFYCGDFADAKQIAVQLIEDCNYEAVDAGNLITARSLETLATAWVQFAVASKLFPRLGLKAIRN